MITLLGPGQYRRTPWKNGGGTTVDIAGENGVWLFGRTPIVAPGPFSDYSGFDRLQVLVAGSGLALDTPAGEIDVRVPFRPVRFAGETPIVSRLEDGPVEVVNLIGARDRVRLDLVVLESDRRLSLPAGRHVIYCPGHDSAMELAGDRRQLAADHALQIDVGTPTMLACSSGRLVVASVLKA